MYIWYIYSERERENIRFQDKSEESHWNSQPSFHCPHRGWLTVIRSFERELPFLIRLLKPLISVASAGKEWALVNFVNQQLSAKMIVVRLFVCFFFFNTKNLFFKTLFLSLSLLLFLFLSSRRFNESIGKIGFNVTYLKKINHLTLVFYLSFYFILFVYFREFRLLLSFSHSWQQLSQVFMSLWPFPRMTT